MKKQGMFAVPKDRLVKGLEKLRSKVCVYSPGMERCDCKYGVKSPTQFGESHGCPEARLAARLFAVMPGFIYRWLLRRANCELSYEPGTKMKVKKRF